MSISSSTLTDEEFLRYEEIEKTILKIINDSLSKGTRIEPILDALKNNLDCLRNPNLIDNSLQYMENKGYIDKRMEKFNIPEENTILFTPAYRILDPGKKKLADLIENPRIQKIR